MVEDIQVEAVLTIKEVYLTNFDSVMSPMTT